MKGVIKAVIAGAVIIFIGVAIILGTLACNGWSVKKPEFEMLTYTAEYENTSLDIEIGAGSVKTEFYDGDRITIDYPSSSFYKNKIGEKDGALYYESELKWHWGSLDIPDTIIKLPKDVKFKLTAVINAGSAIVASGEYERLFIDVNAGTLTVNDTVCSHFGGEVSAGKLEVKGLICDRFSGVVSAGKLDVKRLNCPDITAIISAGTLEIGIDGAKSEYDVKTDVSAGSCNVVNQTGTGDKKLNVECSAGTVKVTFTG